MRYHEIIDEAPIIDFDIYGDPNTEGSFRRDDLAAMRNPKWLKKIETAFSRTPFQFSVYLFNAPGGEVDFGNGPIDVRSLEHLDDNGSGVKSVSTAGHVKPTVVRQVIEQKLNLRGKITVVLLENEGAGRLPLTPWILAHRIAHAISLDTPDEDLQTCICDLRETFERMVDLVERSTDDKDNYLRAATMFGTMRSAREGNFANPGDFFTELVAQYIVRGAIRLNRPEGLEDHAVHIEGSLNRDAKVLLQQCVGKAFIL